jgi:PBP1b-binding outer membrane lipoprotein LpoB
MRKKALHMLKLAILLWLIGCSQIVSGQVLRSKKPRNTSSAIDETGVAMLVDIRAAMITTVTSLLTSRSK